MKILAALLMFAAVPALSQSIATCPTAVAGTAWATGAWLPCTPAVVYVAAPVPATAIVATLNGTASWKLASKLASTDNVWSQTGNKWVAFSTLPTATATVAIGATAHLSWVAPTANTDGSVLTDLKSYNVYQNGTKIAPVAAPAGAYAVPGLAAGTYTFAVSAVNAAGLESALANAPPATVSQVVTPKTPTAPGSVTVSVTITVP